MAKRIGTYRRKTRNKLKRPSNKKSTIPIRKYLQVFKTGEKVVFKADSVEQNGMYFPRVHSKVGIIEGKQGKSYLVSYKEDTKKKVFIVNPVHLQKVK